MGEGAGGTEVKYGDRASSEHPSMANYGDVDGWMGGKRNLINILVKVIFLLIT